MKKAFLFLIIFFSFLAFTQAQEEIKANSPGAGNPILPGYFADPTVKKIDGIYYIYATTDNEMLASGAPTLWYSNDFQNWYNYTLEIPSLSSVNLRNYWAPDMVEGDDGRYYLYFGNCQAGCKIYGYVADTPYGPWTKLHDDDTPVIPDGYPIDGFPSLDAQFFKDDDGTIYAHWGTWVHYNDGYAVGELDNRTMATVSKGENIPVEQTPQPFEAPYMLKKNDKYILMYSSASCHDETYNVRYSYSDSPYGPFTPGENNPVLSSNDDLSVHGPGHHSVLKNGDDYYIAYHRHDYPMTRGGMSRQVCVDSLIFENDSTIRKVIPSHQGIKPFEENKVPDDIAYKAETTASSYYHLEAAGYDYSYLPSYATDNNNATMWKAADNSLPQHLTIDLGTVQKVSRVMTRFEFASYYYRYTLEYSENGKKWKMYADRSDNYTPGSPMIDDNNVRARYIRLNVLDTEKTGLLAAVWNIKVYSSLFDIPLGLVSKASVNEPGPRSSGEMVFGFDLSGISVKDSLDGLPNTGTAGGSFTRHGDLSMARDENGVKAIEFTRGSLVLEDTPVPQSLAWNGSYTVATWVKNPEVAGEGECLASWCDRYEHRLANSWNALFYNSGNYGAAAHLDGHFDMRYRNVPEENKWHHIVLTFDGLVEKIYVNGIVDNSQVMTLASAVDKARFIIGASDGRGENYSGFMASLQMYDYALTQEEINKLMKKTDPEPVSRNTGISDSGESSAANQITKKELYIPEKVFRIPEGNDYNNNESEYSYDRMVESSNIAIFWHREYGDDPLINPNESKRFDVQELLSECERFYNYYVDELKMVQKSNSLTDKYKLLVYVFGGDEGTAFGGGAEDKIGVLWTNASRIRKGPYGVLAHEMGHSFQFLSRIDAGSGPGGAISEMSAQYMLWQVYPEWMTFENYHLVDFMNKTHYAFLHPINMYHTPYVLEYWSHKHGKDFFGKLSRETAEGEDPVMTYKRISSITQEQFNDEIFDAYRRFMTWDMKRIENVARPYANQHHTIINEDGEGWYRIAPEKCPQNYGYNGIRLKAPSGGTNVMLTFEGIAGDDAYNSVKVDKAGWRYGFVASLEDGRRIYGDILEDANGKAAFRVPEDTEHLWLVVSGAPTEHWPVASRRRGQSGEESPEEQWPYRFKLQGTAPADQIIQ